MDDSKLFPRYEARVINVVSGDDLILMIDLGIDDLFKKKRVRLFNVDTPDAFRAGDDTPAGQVRNDIRKLTRSKDCEIEVHSQGRGGWIVTLYVKDGNKLINVNELLRKRGFVFQQNEEKRRDGG